MSHRTEPDLANSDPVAPLPTQLGARVTQNLGEAPGVRRLVVEPLEPWSFSAGQVAELVAEPGSEGFFAIATAPHELPSLAFLIKAGGSASEPLMSLAVGSELTIRGPYGRGFDVPSQPRPPLLFVAAGTAIAAARSGLLEALGADRATTPPGALTLVVGVRHQADLCFSDELAHLEDRGVTVRVAVSQPGPITAPNLRPGRVQDHLADLVSTSTHAFLAGSEAFEDDVEAALATLGVGHAQVQRNYRPDHRSRPT